MEKILGAKAESKDGIVKFAVAREPAMNTWLGFAGTDDHAFVHGQIGLRESQLSMALRALRHYDINVVGIHHHIPDAAPPLFSVYFWGKGKGITLANALKTVLDAQIK